MEYKVCDICKKRYSSYGTDGNATINMCPRCREKHYDQKRQHQIQQNKTQYVPKCPTCGCPDIEKIGGIERAGSILTLGIFSKKINKSFKCTNCGYMW